MGMVFTYPTTFVGWTLIILFADSLEIRFFQITKNCERKYWIFKNIDFFKMKASKLISYLRGMCQSSQGTTLHVYGVIYVLPHDILLYVGACGGWKNDF